MWLLDTRRAVLVYFVSPESIKGGYAILSHVWDDKEQSFQDVQELGKRCAATGENPRDLVCEKIREFCIIAESYGYKWGWADTCCIDKSSSAELSEAINSMYRYYTLADTCYAYLRDVPSHEDIWGRNSSFRMSRWHVRGWTLQELIAPTLLIFLSQDWKMLGTKAELADLLEDAAQVPATVLRSEEELTDFSIAQRMSWAAPRSTTRQEDEAYCLMGIFGVNMPTLYGEGRQSFRRLQEEIMRQSIDTTIFAWGDHKYIYDSEEIPPVPNRVHDHDDPYTYLFATSTTDFIYSSDVSFIPPRSISEMTPQTNAPRLETQVDVSGTTSPVQPAGLPIFSVTPYGVHARVPVIKGLSVAGFMVAIMFWGWGDRDQRRSVGFLLTPCLDAVDPLRPLYHCGFAGVRVVPLKGHTLDDLSFNGEKVVAEWKEFYIAHITPPNTKHTPRLPINSGLCSPFRFPLHQMELLGNRGFKLTDFSSAPYTWDGHPPLRFVFKFNWQMQARTMVVRLGRCVASPQVSKPSGSDQGGARWASLRYYGDQPPSEHLEHSCLEDHISEWPNFRKTFVDRHFTWGPPILTLSFMPWKPDSPTSALIANFKVK